MPLNYGDYQVFGTWDRTPWAYLCFGISGPGVTELVSTFRARYQTQISYNSVRNVCAREGQQWILNRAEDVSTVFSRRGVRHVSGVLLEQG